jgi:hypothetical protein
VQHHTIDGGNLALSRHPLQLLDDPLEAAAQLGIGADGLLRRPLGALGLRKSVQHLPSRIGPTPYQVGGRIQWSQGGVARGNPLSINYYFDSAMKSYSVAAFQQPICRSPHHRWP